MIVFGFDKKKGEIQMRKKFVVALVAAMSLTVAGTGTVFAMDKVSTIASEKEHVHGDNCEWVVDKEAWDETVHHPAEYKTVHHPAEYDTIHHPAEYDTIHHPEEGHMEIEMHLTCNGCGQDFGVVSPESQALWEAHMKEMVGNGDYSHMGYGTEQKEVWIVDKPAWDEQVLIKDAWDEQVLVKEAWDEIVNHPEEGHWECNGESQEPEQKPENPDQKPEQPENPDQKPEQPENPDQKPEQPEQPENPDQKPEQPENPDQKPEQPENPDVETPENPDTENPATPEQKPEANKENVQTQETKKKGTSPKTGDTASALPVAGAGLASLGVALATILKKRK